MKGTHGKPNEQVFISSPGGHSATSSKTSHAQQVYMYDIQEPPHLHLPGFKFSISIFGALMQCILVDSSTVTCWTSPFVILGALGLF